VVVLPVGVAGQEPTPTSTPNPTQTPTPTPTPPAPDDPDLAAARIAWRYFERNTSAATGLVSSVDGYPSTTAWDLGSSILAALAAHELGLLDAAALDARLAKLLRTLEALPLYAGELPNKAYHAETGQMTDYANRPAAAGIGFSAIDLGRLVSALALAGDLRPSLREPVLRVLGRWNTCRLARGGELHGVHRGPDGKPRLLQEGRLGYEQYAAKALALLGLDTGRAQRYERHLASTELLGVSVPHDARDRARFGAVDALVTEPWALDGLELGLGGGGAPLAARVFEVQKRRWQGTGIPTALSEDHVDRAPWFVYGGIVAEGRPWTTVDPEGREVPGLRALSTKAAFALAALHPRDPYARVLRRAVERRRPKSPGATRGGRGSPPSRRAGRPARSRTRAPPAGSAGRAERTSARWSPSAHRSRRRAEGTRGCAPAARCSPPTAARRGRASAASPPSSRGARRSCGSAPRRRRAPTTATRASCGASAGTTGAPAPSRSPCTTGGRSAPTTRRAGARPRRTSATSSPASARSGSASRRSRR
jgi:hypothetical protein